MRQNADLLAKIGADTAENEQHFAAILPIGRRVADHGPARSYGMHRGPLEAHRGASGRAPRRPDEATSPQTCEPLSSHFKESKCISHP